MEGTDAPWEEGWTITSAQEGSDHDVHAGFNAEKGKHKATLAPGKQKNQKPSRENLLFTTVKTENNFHRLWNTNASRHNFSLLFLKFVVVQ